MRWQNLRCCQFVSNITNERASTSRGKPHTGTNAHAVGAGLCPSIDYQQNMSHVRTRQQPRSVILPTQSVCMLNKFTLQYTKINKNKVFQGFNYKNEP